MAPEPSRFGRHRLLLLVLLTEGSREETPEVSSLVEARDTVMR